MKTFRFILFTLLSVLLMTNFAQGSSSIASKLFNLNNPAVMKEFNPFQAQNLWRSKLVEVEVPATTLVGGQTDQKLFFPKDEFLEKCWITRIDYVNTYTNIGTEFSPSRKLLFYGPFSAYLNVRWEQDIVIEDMPLQFCSFEGRNNIFRNAYPFRMDFDNSFIRFRSYDPATNTLLANSPQTMMFQVWYIPFEGEENKNLSFKTPFKYNPYRDQSWFKYKFLPVQITADPGNFLNPPGQPQRINLKYNKYLDNRLVNRVVSLDPANLGPVDPTNAAWQVGPDPGQIFYNDAVSANITIVDKNAVILDDVLLEYTAETNDQNGFRNLIPFNIDTARSFITFNSRVGAISPVGQYFGLGFYYLPDWLSKELQRG